MEALIVLISEFMLVLAIAGIIFSFAAIFTIVFGGINLGVNANAKTKKVNWLRRVSITVTILFAFTIGLVLAIQLVLFEPTARLVLDQVKNRTGIEMTFESVKGNLFNGTVHMQGVKLKREHHQKSIFDLQAKEISVDMDMTGLITFKTVIEELKVTDLKGTFQRIGKVTHLKPRRSFTIENFIMEDVDIEFTDTTRGVKPVTAAVKIETMHSTPFRSQLSIFDVLFNSTFRGTLARDSSFAIEKRETQETRSNQWIFNDLPLKLMGEFVGGPFRFITEGGIFIDVQNQWQTGKTSKIKMDWHLVIRDINARVPEEYPDSGIKRNLADGVVTYINDHSREFSFQFSLDVNEETFKYLVSFEDTGFQAAFRKQLTVKLVELAGKNKEKIKELGKKGIKKFKEFLDKRKN